ncbi:MAG: hypothetical protein JWL80_241 [Parcubacteria group bacterium]|nr:hypothetical protein [Parcubacteria group bacterium]
MHIGKFKIAVLVGAIILIGVPVFIFKIFTTQANEAVFYPSSCLGGWKDPHNAEGKPEVSSDTVTMFNNENSAVLPENTSAEIFCGKFTGTIPEDTRPQKVLLTFSWDAKRGAIPDDEDNAPGSLSVEATTTPAEDSAASSTPAVPEPIVSEPAPPIESVEAPPVNVPEESPTSLLKNILFTKAYAQETDATSTPVIVPSFSPLFEILYTLDGTQWINLGTVDEEHLRYSIFEIPIDSHGKWQDISTIQINIKSVSSLDSNPPIYLDGMALEITYEDNKAAFAPASGLYVSKAHASSPDLTFEIRDHDEVEELVVSSQDTFGGLVVYSAATEELKLNTNVDATSYILQPEYFGPGDYVIVRTPDPNTCSTKSLLACRAGAGGKEGEFTVGTASSL